MGERHGGELRFDGRVAVVTGAGGGLGRAHALLLAARGARVVVNDLGGGPTGEGSSEALAHAVAREIEQAGGVAVADVHSVASPDSAEAIIQAALAAFGRLDIVIHNAGIVGGAPIEELSAERLDALLDVHVRGAFFVTRPAWARMRAQGYGRMLYTISNAGLFGLAGASIYSAAKGALVGLTRSLANEAVDSGIHVNALAPAAYTRLTAGIQDDWFKQRFAPECVAPVAAWLVHERCPSTGEIFSAGGGRVARVFTAETPGYAADNLTLEAVRDNFEQIRSQCGYTLPASSQDEMRLYRKLIG